MRRISRIVSKPSISGIMMSISTMSGRGVLDELDRLAAVIALTTSMSWRSRSDGQCEDVADVVVDDQHLLAVQHFIAGAAIEHLLLGRGRELSR